jgi:hypothetical protein
MLSKAALGGEGKRVGVEPRLFHVFWPLAVSSVGAVPQEEGEGQSFGTFGPWLKGIGSDDALSRFCLPRLPYCGDYMNLYKPIAINHR